MTKAVRIPVTVKMRAGWDERGDQRAGAGAPHGGCRRGGGRRARPHGRAVVFRVFGLGSDQARGRRASPFPVFGSGDCIEPAQLVDKLRGGGVAGVLVGRGALRNPWIFEQAADVGRRASAARDHAWPSAGSSCSNTSICCCRNASREAEGFRHVAPGQTALERAVPARGHDGG